MNSLLCLILLSTGYYILYQYFPERFEEKYHYYFGGFVIIYIFILYLFTFENEFMYKLFKNVYDTSRQPLYTFNAQQSNSELYHTLNPNQNIKQTLAQQQMYRCYNCQNHMVQNDIEYYKMQYQTPLQNGGQNIPENLKLICPSCYSFQ